MILGRRHPHIRPLTRDGGRALRAAPAARRPVMVCLVLLICVSAAAHLAAEEPSVTFQAGPLAPRTVRLTSIVPVLVVEEAAADASRASQNFQARYQKLTLEYERSGRAAPFRLAIIQENPGSAGPQLESSIWLAAMVAALQRSDNLSGVRVTVEVAGEIDGPSAGGVVCLALLSALDGKMLPHDFAFTGAILPDGGIGRVGGMVEKIAAAKRGRVSRVLVPAGFRMEAELATGEQVDLKRLAQEKGLQFLPVHNIQEAYQRVHGTPAPPARTAPPGFADLPPQLETLLITEIRADLAAGDRQWKALSPQEQEQLQADPVFSYFLAARAAADESFRAGSFAWAHDQADVWREMMRARDQYAQVVRAASIAKNLFGTDPATEPDRFLKLCDGLIASRFEEAPQPSDILQQLAPRLPPISAQLCTELNNFFYLKQVVLQLEDRLPQDLAALPEGQNRAERMRATKLTNNYSQMILAEAAHGYQQRAASEIQEQSKHLAAVPLAPGRALATERFFYTAARSTWNLFEAQVVAPAAAEENISTEQVLQRLAAYDETLRMQIVAAGANEILHRRVLAPPASGAAQEFEAALGALLFARQVAVDSSLLMRWSELDLEFDAQGAASYGRTRALSHLLSEARTTAAFNLAICQKAGIPCPEPIRHFEAAEAGRDDPAQDKVDVLASYWTASLQAQALKMLFQASPSP